MRFNRAYVKLARVTAFRAWTLALRPRQWAKNAFVVIPILFSRSLGDPHRWVLAVAAFVLFCLVSSSVYVINDLFDCEQDRVHPEKRSRPIASGAVGVQAASLTAAVFALVGIGGSFALGAHFLAAVAVYFVLNVLYSTWLKNVVIIDVMALASFYVLRVVGGAIAIGVGISYWLVICTLLLSLFLGFSKRRHELTLMTEGAVNHRSVLAHYSPYFLDQMTAVVLAATVMSYALYTVSAETYAHFGTHGLLLTLPFVLYGIFRYMYLVHQQGRGGSPTAIVLGDWPFLANLVLWLAACALIIYWPTPIL